jgi:host factor-I protein
MQLKLEMGVDSVSKSQFNLQDAFLNQVRKEKMPVTIFLVNGFQIKGVVRGFDNFTVVVELDQKQQLVYKHAISTVAPLKPMNIATLDTARHNEEE